MKNIAFVVLCLAMLLCCRAVYASSGNDLPDLRDYSTAATSPIPLGSIPVSAPVKSVRRQVPVVTYTYDMPGTGGGGCAGYATYGTPVYGAGGCSGFSVGYGAGGCSGVSYGAGGCSGVGYSSYGYAPVTYVRSSGGGLFGTGLFGGGFCAGGICR